MVALGRHWTGCGIVLASMGVSSGLLALASYNLVPLSSGFAWRAACAAAAGITLFAAGTWIAWFTLRRLGRSWKIRLIYAILFSSFIGWCLFCGLVYCVQDRLLFSPRGLTETRHAIVTQAYPNAEEVQLTVGEDTLHGWFLPPAAKQGPAPLILLFYGQGGEASRYFQLAENIPEAAWAFINYRGYGWSTGVPSEEAFFADALAIYDYFAGHPLVDGNRIVALAGSLGTGVAVYLAAQRPLAGVVLFSPYDAIGGGVASDLIPLVPTQWLLRNRFAVLSYARITKAPVLAVVGEADAVIRPHRSLSLMENWVQPNETVIIPGGTHYSIYETQASWDAVRTFLANLGLI